MRTSMSDTHLCTQQDDATSGDGMDASHRPHTPYNGAAHEALIADGYAHMFVPGYWCECGSAESGPAVDGHCGYDQYSKVLGIDDEGLYDMVEFIYIAEDGQNGVEVLPDYPEGEVLL
jgi:hypothetical protein